MRNAITACKRCCGKIMFSQVSVCSQVWWVCLGVGTHPPLPPKTRYNTGYGRYGTHPTGMLSCLYYFIDLKKFGCMVLYCFFWKKHYISWIKLRVLFQLYILRVFDFWWNYRRDSQIKYFLLHWQMIVRVVVPLPLWLSKNCINTNKLTKMYCFAFLFEDILNIRL